MLRSDTFNPALRVKQTVTADTGDEESIKDVSEKRSVKSADGIKREREKRPSEAEYRRLQG